MNNINCVNGCLTTDHQILTENGWKDYLAIERKKIGPDGKPTGSNEKLKVYDINTNTIDVEEFSGELFYSKSNKVIYDIKNEYIDTSITEDHKMLYKFNLTDSIKIDTLNEILYNMIDYNYNIVYFFTNSDTIVPIEIKYEEFIRNVIEVEVFSFITSKKTFYVRRNNLEFWTSY